MSDLSVSHVFNTGDVIDASKFNTNYTTDIAGYINNRNTGTSSWDSFYVTNASGVPLTVNNSTGSVNIADFKDNGTSVLTITDGGIVTADGQQWARAYLPTDKALSLSGITSVLCTAVDETQSVFSGGSFTCPQRGIYFIHMALYYPTAIGYQDQTSQAQIRKNGGTVSLSVNIKILTNMALSVTDILLLEEGDILTFRVEDDSAETGTSIVGGSSTTYCNVFKIS